MRQNGEDRYQRHRYENLSNCDHLAHIFINHSGSHYRYSYIESPNQCPVSPYFPEQQLCVLATRESFTLYTIQLICILHGVRETYAFIIRGEEEFLNRVNRLDGKPNNRAKQRKAVDNDNCFEDPIIVEAKQNLSNELTIRESITGEDARVVSPKAR